jgi:hypothetical protein
MLQPSNSGMAPTGGPALTRSFQVSTSSFSWTGVAGRGGGGVGAGCAVAGRGGWAGATAATDQASAAAPAEAKEPAFVILPISRASLEVRKGCRSAGRLTIGRKS